jgi:hypothetical protein
MDTGVEGSEWVFFVSRNAEYRRSESEDIWLPTECSTPHQHSSDVRYSASEGASYCSGNAPNLNLHFQTLTASRPIRGLFIKHPTLFFLTYIRLYGRVIRNFSERNCVRCKVTKMCKIAAPREI